MICQSSREIAKHFRINHKYMSAVESMATSQDIAFQKNPEPLLAQFFEALLPSNDKM